MNEFTPSAKLIKPPNKIKQKLSSAVNVRDLLNPETVNKAQKAIDERKDSFLIWADEDIEALTEHLSALKKDTITKELLEKIVKCGEHLRDRGGTFGYELISLIAKSLVNYCLTIHQPDPKHTVVIEKHIDGLKTILHERIEGNGGVMGTELIKGLQQLTAKYSQ